MNGTFKTSLIAHLFFIKYFIAIKSREKTKKNSGIFACVRATIGVDSNNYGIGDREILCSFAMPCTASTYTGNATGNMNKVNCELMTVLLGYSAASPARVCEEASRDCLRPSPVISDSWRSVWRRRSRRCPRCSRS